MTVDEMRARLDQIWIEEQALRKEHYRLTLAVEEAEGRPKSKDARFARACLAGDLKAMDEICAEDTADYYRKTGRWSTHQPRAEKILAAS